MEETFVSGSDVLVSLAKLLSIRIAPPAELNDHLAGPSLVLAGSWPALAPPRFSDPQLNLRRHIRRPLRLWKEI